MDVTSEQRVPLEDEVYADWALHPRESLVRPRREARLALARDRFSGLGQSGTLAAIESLA